MGGLLIASTQAFFLVQATFALPPITLFASFIVSTLLFAASAALIFALFWIGIALLILVPTLLATFSISIGVWAWGVASFIILRWLYNMIPSSVKGGVDAGSSNGKAILHPESGRDEKLRDLTTTPSSATHSHPNPATIPGSGVNGADGGPDGSL